jgi:uncharacterized Rmd1/YagE family protein
MRCCGGNNNSGNADLIKYNQDKIKRKSKLTWIVVIVVLLLLVFSVLH